MSMVESCCWCRWFSVDDDIIGSFERWSRLRRLEGWLLLRWCDIIGSLRWSSSMKSSTLLKPIAWTSLITSGICYTNRQLNIFCFELKSNLLYARHLWTHFDAADETMMHLMTHKKPSFLHLLTAAVLLSSTESRVPAHKSTVNSFSQVTTVKCSPVLASPAVCSAFPCPFASAQPFSICWFHASKLWCNRLMTSEWFLCWVEHHAQSRNMTRCFSATKFQAPWFDRWCWNVDVFQL